MRVPLHPDLAGWSPPTGWQPVPTSDPRVTAWAPPAETAPTDARTAYKCPSCGAATGFDVDTQGVHCPYCGFTRQIDAATVGRAAAAEEFLTDTLQADQRGWGTDRRELHCGACGTDLSVEPGALTSTCPYCASNEVLVREATIDALRPRWLAPFALSAADASARARKWLGRGWMHPDDLGRVAAVGGMTGVYVPFWTFSARLASTWEAEVGTERTERRYRDGKWESHTVIDWSWQRGSVTTDVRDLVVPGTGRLSARLLGRLDPWDLDALVPYDADFLAGWSAQAADVALADGWTTGRERMRDRAKADCMSDTGSSHVRSFSLHSDLQDETWRYVLLPVWVAAYRYDGRTFRVLVDGRAGRVAGQKPVAWWKVWLAIGAMWSVVAGLVFVGLLTLIVAIGGVFLVLGLFAAIGAGAGSFWLYNQAIDAEAE